MPILEKLKANRGLILGLNCYLAGIAALFIAFVFDLPNPWWALLTVFFTSQPINQGGVWAKATFRLGGTAVGVTFVLIALPNLVDDPELFIACLASWVGLCLTISLLDRTPKSYFPMLAGYTAALVGLPLINNPGNVFDIAIARTEEILIGVCCAAIAQSVLFPRRVHDVTIDKATACELNASAWSVSALKNDDSARKQRLKYANSVVDLVLVSSALPYESPYRRRHTKILQALTERLASILPFVDAIDDRTALLQERGGITARIQAIAAQLESWITSKRPDRYGALAIQTACDQLTENGDGSSWLQLEQSALVGRLRVLSQTWYECRALIAALRDHADDASSHVDLLINDARKFRLHSDGVLALWSGLAAALAILAAGYFAILIQWDTGTLSIAVAAVNSCLFATFDDPTPLLRKTFQWTVVSIPIGFVYVFGILPPVNSFAALCVALFPLLFFCGYLLSNPKTAIPALQIASVSTSVIALQSSYSANFETFWNSSISAAVGALMSLFTIQSVRIIASQTVSNRLVRRGWKDLAILAAHGIKGYKIFASLMLDRIGLLVSRAPTSSLIALNGLRDLRLGVNLTELIAASEDFSVSDRNLVTSFRKIFAGYINCRFDKKKRDQYHPSLMTAIELIKRASLDIKDASLRLRTIMALTGIRNGIDFIHSDMNLKA